MTTATVNGRALAPSLVAELCDADLSVRSCHVRLYRRDADVDATPLAVEVGA